MLRPISSETVLTATTMRSVRCCSGINPFNMSLFIRPDVGALPWIGRRTGRGAASDFIRDAPRLIEQLRFDVQDILASDDRAVIVGELVTRIIRSSLARC